MFHLIHYKSFQKMISKRILYKVAKRIEIKKQEHKWYMQLHNVL